MCKTEEESRKTKPSSSSHSHCISLQTARGWKRRGEIDQFIGVIYDLIAAGLRKLAREEGARSKKKSVKEAGSSLFSHTAEFPFSQFVYSWRREGGYCELPLFLPSFLPPPLLLSLAIHALLLSQFPRLCAGGIKETVLLRDRQKKENKNGFPPPSSCRCCATSGPSSSCCCRPTSCRT